MFKQPLLNGNTAGFPHPSPSDQVTPYPEGDEERLSTELPLDEFEKPLLPSTWRLWRKWRPISPRHLFWLMVPSFVARAFGHASEDSAIPAPNATSYLNGLRGIASLIVALQETIDGDYGFIIHHAWGEGNDNRYLVQLPFIRLFHSGVFMVSVFFVISGFALTYGPLKKSHAARAHAGQVDAAIKSFPSSIFRRPFRLFLPTVPIIAVSTALVPFGAFYALNSTEPMPPVAQGFCGHIHYIWTTLLMVITSGSTNTVMPQGWTHADC
ncbi:hypothetical protein Cob_v007913 [Colletotrichum orbiculare MAFF 240422]|uniref:Uncharacterized protein n=1 Tax=Colletotrichum orbiculare (strain 104-T / ATCC 96160 / CBS 514.97 / LARS 414 / MAFF 240422) TaxID=1213857 RepID=A0A484FMM4_COLOR|nr:hypothetical protein Cob_v007913 [Colletotrichum orbiculare MAFF 240422]